MAIRIICDHRETRNPILPFLEKMGAELIIKELQIGDYIVSDRTGFEYKTGGDFLNSVIGIEKGKVFRQCSELALEYERPALLIGCGLSDIFTARNIHPNAVWAFLQTIIWLGCPVRFLNTAEIAAIYIFETAKKEQENIYTDFCEHGLKTKKSPAEQKEYIISAIPGVGIHLAKELLKQFGSIESIVKATEKELQTVSGLGPVTAAGIKKIVSGIYF